MRNGESIKIFPSLVVPRSFLLPLAAGHGRLIHSVKQLKRTRASTVVFVRSAQINYASKIEVWMSEWSMCVCSILRKPWHCTCRCFNETIFIKQSVRIYRLRILPILSSSFDCLLYTTFLNRHPLHSDIPEKGAWKIGMKSKLPRMSRLWIYSQWPYVMSFGSNTIFESTILSLRILLLRRKSSPTVRTFHTQIHRYSKSFDCDRLVCLIWWAHAMGIFIATASRNVCGMPVFAISFSNCHTQTNSVYTLHATRTRRPCSAECRRTNRSVCRRVVSSSMCRCRQIYRVQYEQNRNRMRTRRHSFGRYVCVSVQWRIKHAYRSRCMHGFVVGVGAKSKQ